MKKKLILWLASKWHPELVQSKAELMASIRSLGEKLRYERNEREEYRQRCFSAENVLRNMQREVRDAAKEHDKTHGTTISFGL